MGNTLGNPSTQNMNATDVKNANAMASGNRLNAAKTNAGYSFSIFNIFALLYKQNPFDAERAPFFGPLARMQFFDSDGGAVRGDGFKRIVQLLLCRVEAVNLAFCFCGICDIGVRST